MKRACQGMNESCCRRTRCLQLGHRSLKARDEGSTREAARARHFSLLPTVACLMVLFVLMPLLMLGVLQVAFR